MAAEGEIIYSKVEFSDTFVSEKYGYPSMFFITDNIDKITKVIAYDETGRKSVSVFNNNVSEVVKIGTITTNSSKVFIAVHSSGANEVLIDGNNYTKIVSDEFSYTPITPGNIKVLLVYALPTTQLFYLAEGLAGTEAVDPELPINSFLIKRIIVSYDGVTMDEIESGFRQKSVDSWVTQIGMIGGSPQAIYVHYLSTRFIVKSDGTNLQLGGFHVHPWADLYNGQPISVRNDSNSDLLITTITGSTNPQLYPINPSHIPMTLKKGETAQFAINFNSHTVDIIKSPGGGSAEFPPFSSDNLVLMSDSTAPGKVKWSNRLLDRLTSSIQEITGRVDFLGFLKSKHYFFTTDTTANTLGNATPDKLSSDGIDVFHTPTMGVTEKLLKQSTLQLNVKTGIFNPPTLAQLTALGVKRGDFYKCSTTNQIAMFNGDQIAEWTVTTTVFNSLTTDQKNGVKNLFIIT